MVHKFNSKSVNSVEPRSETQVLEVNKLAALHANHLTRKEVAVAPQSVNESFDLSTNRSQLALTKLQTRQVANEVYQLINQRLRFEKRRRGLV